VPAAGLEPATY